MASVLIIVFSRIQHDARLRRQIGFLSPHHRVTVVCLDAPAMDGIEVIRLPEHKLTFAKKAFAGFFFFFRIYAVAYRLLYPYQQVVKNLRSRTRDLVIANDVETLPLAFEFKHAGSKILFDAHEYAPRHFENVWSWRIFFQPFNIHLCKKYLPKVDGMITVGWNIADEYHRHFGVLPEVITNAPGRQSLKPVATANVIRLVHHGICTPSRKIERMIEMMRLLPDHFELDLILMSPERSSPATIAYMESLKALASFTNRIHFLPAVSVEEILPVLNQYDVGIILIPPVNFNYKHTLPNKFFDFIQARLALAIAPTPEISAIVKKYKLGVVSEDFSAGSLARQIGALTPEMIQQFKNNTEQAAAEFCAEHNSVKFLSLVDQILSKKN